MSTVEIERPAKISFGGDVSGSVEIPASGNATAYITVNRALMADLAKEVLTVPTAKKSIESSHAAVADVASRCSGNAQTATRLKNLHTINLTGDIDAEINFDGKEDLIVEVKVKNSDSATCDENGDNIADTYARKDELPQVKFRISEDGGAFCLYAIYEGKIYRFVGEEI